MNKQNYKEIAEILRDFVKAYKLAYKDDALVRSLPTQLGHYFERVINATDEEGLCLSPDSVHRFDKAQFLKDCGVQE